MTDTAFSTQHPSSAQAAAPASYKPVPPPAKALFSLGNVVTLIVLAVLIAIPFYSKSFFVFQMNQMIVYAIAILGLNILTGINGQFSLGHSAFYAIGAYTCAIMVEMAGVNYMLTLPFAAVISFIVGFLFGFPALRLDGLYLALATFALAVATPQLLKLSLIEDYTGGVQGILLFSETFDAPVPFGLSMDPSTWVYFFSLFVFGLIYVLSMALVKSRSGRALMAIRDNPIAARSMGINMAYYKATAFGISAMITGIAGALSAIVIKFVAPDSFTFFIAVLILVGMVIGGVGWLPGCLIGALAMLYLPNIAEVIDDIVIGAAGLIGMADALPAGSALEQQFIRLSGVIYGIILILVIYLAPSGAGGFIRAIVTRAKALTSKS
ncbi:MAG: branched-chain amino acid ABC transporter permease [Pseudomonadota bacterium]